jgi:CRISPR-associated protein Csm1
MTNTDLLSASSRVALAAYLHDLGKFAERADMPVEKNKLEIHLQMYCPKHEAGGRTYYTHRHAAYTALALDELDDWLPELTGAVFPFGGWRTREAVDSICNAAARHHRPDSFLQWVIATADRMASGFERDQWDMYNKAEDQDKQTGLNHVTARQLTLFEQITLDAPNTEITPRNMVFRYALKPLSPKTIFPVKREDCEGNNKDKAKGEYLQLWKGFIRDIQRIPFSHRQDLTLWLDHFDSLWACYSHAIPSATAFGTRPDVALYDHSRTTAALAVAIWRYHHDLNHEQEDVTQGLRTRTGEYGWGEQKLLLVQGDFFGIQRFIFAGGRETNKKSAKLLRGRSFYVSLITELAALKTLEALSLPGNCQILNAAGKFLVVAPNTPATIKALEEVRQQLNQWFIDNSFGIAGLGLVWQAASPEDFLQGGHSKAGFQRLMSALFEQLENAKYQHFGLCGDESPSSVMPMDNPVGPCVLNEYLPADPALQAGDDPAAGYYSRLSRDQLTIGHCLATDHYSRLAISRESLSSSDAALKLPVFGYHCLFTADEDDSGRFGPEITCGNLRRLYDFSLPEVDADKVLFKGYARRAINGYVARFQQDELTHLNYEKGRYQGLDSEELEALDKADRIKTLNHLACESRLPKDATLDSWKGVPALVTLKGDIDDLGAIFQQGIKPVTFAKMAALSRQVNAFFTVYLPWLCQFEPAYRNTYTVFAGGDDFFLIGPWRQTINLSLRLREDFTRYVAGNSQLHFSVGLYLHKPGGPVTYVAEQAEHTLAMAKGLEGKDAVALLGNSMHWSQLRVCLALQKELEDLTLQFRFSTGFLYQIMEITDMAAQSSGPGALPRSSLWRSKLAYVLKRFTERHRKENGDKASESDLMTLIRFFEKSIREQGGAFRIPLTLHLYQERSNG